VTLWQIFPQVTTGFMQNTTFVTGLVKYCRALKNAVFFIDASILLLSATFSPHEQGHRRTVIGCDMRPTNKGNIILVIGGCSSRHRRKHRPRRRIEPLSRSEDNIIPADTAVTEQVLRLSFRMDLRSFSHEIIPIYR